MVEEQIFAVGLSGFLSAVVPDRLDSSCGDGHCKSHSPDAIGQRTCDGDSLAERNEFEPAVPILEQPDDSWLFGSTAL
jgi:hypothetical protein